MKAYTYSEARQKLAAILTEVERSGPVRIRRRDGSSLVLKREPRTGSPLDVKGIGLGLSRREIAAIAREGRRDVRFSWKR